LSLFVGALAATAFSIQAQEVRATVGGRVTDAQGAAVPNVAVTLAAEDTNVDQHTRTNTQCSWSVQFLNPGRYTLTITADGFKTFHNNGIELQAADIKQIDAVPELGSNKETITVTSDVPLRAVDRYNVGHFRYRHHGNGTPGGSVRDTHSNTLGNFIARSRDARSKQQCRPSMVLQRRVAIHC
jgi:Carboxypeptidase regulatory-like domain